MSSANATLIDDELQALKKVENEEWVEQDDYETRDQEEYEQKLQTRAAQQQMWHEDEQKECAKHTRETTNKQNGMKIAKETHVTNMRDYGTSLAAAGNGTTTAMAIQNYIIQEQKQWSAREKQHQREEGKNSELHTKSREAWTQLRTVAQKVSEEQTEMRKENREKWYANRASNETKLSEDQEDLRQILQDKKAASEHAEKSAEHTQKARVQRQDGDSRAAESSEDQQASQSSDQAASEADNTASEITVKANQTSDAALKNQLLAAVASHISNSSQHTTSANELRDKSEELAVKADQLRETAKENDAKSIEQGEKVKGKHDAIQRTKEQLIARREGREKESIQKAEAEKSQKAAAKAKAAADHAALTAERTTKSCEVKEKALSTKQVSKAKLDTAEEKAVKTAQIASDAIDANITIAQKALLVAANESAYGNATKASKIYNADAATAEAAEQACGDNGALQQEAQAAASDAQTASSDLAANQTAASQNVSSIAATSSSEAQYETDVSLSISGMDASSFDSEMQGVLQASIASSLGMNESQVAIAGVSEEMRSEKYRMTRLGDTMLSSSVVVQVVLSSASKDAATSAKSAMNAKAEDTGAAGLMSAFSANAASAGLEVPSSAGIASVTASVVEKNADGTTTPVSTTTVADEAAQAEQKAESFQEALAAVQAANSAKKLADTLFRKQKGPYDAAVQGVATAEQNLEDVKLQLADAMAAVEDAKSAVRSSEVKKSAAITAVQSAQEVADEAKNAMLAATDKLNVAQKDAAKAAGTAEDLWSDYLKAFADQKSEDAKAKTKSDMTDPWTKIMADAAKPQKNAEGLDCSPIGKKFQTVIYLARDEFMEKAQAQCVSEGRTWRASNAKKLDKLDSLQRQQLADDSESVLDDADTLEYDVSAQKTQNTDVDARLYALDA